MGSMAMGINAYGKNRTWEFNIICGSFLIVCTCLGTLVSSSLAEVMPSSCDREHTCQQIFLSKPRKNSIPGYPGTKVRERLYLCLGHLSIHSSVLLKLIKSKFHRNLCGKGDPAWNRKKRG